MAEVIQMWSYSIDFQTTSGDKYTKTTVQNLDDILLSRGHILISKYCSSLSTNYTPKSNTSLELKADCVLNKDASRVYAIKLAPLRIDLNQLLERCYLLAYIIYFQQLSVIWDHHI